MASPKKDKLYKSSKLSKADDDYFKAQGVKMRYMAVDGKPDQRDVEDLEKLFRMYDRSTGGRLTYMINQNKLERALNNKDYSQLPPEKAETLSFFLPKDLQEVMDIYYPSIWKNKEHLKWFLTHFPVFRT